MPPLPQTINEIDLEGEWTLTDAGEQFLHKLDDGDPKVIFITEKNIELLGDADVLFSDGAFYASPRLFEQIHTIHVEFQGHMFPLVYFLLPNKPENNYVRTLEYVRRFAQDHGLLLSPSTIQLDFAHLRGCLFHFS